MRVRGERGTGPGIYESFHREVHLSGMYEYIRIYIHIYIHICTPHSRLFQRLRAPRQLVRRPAGPGERFAGNPDKLFWYIKLSDPHRDDDGDCTVTHTQQRRGLVRRFRGDYISSYTLRACFLVIKINIIRWWAGGRVRVRASSLIDVPTAKKSWTAVFIDRTLLGTRFTYE